MKHFDLFRTRRVFTTIWLESTYLIAQPPHLGAGVVSENIQDPNPEDLGDPASVRDRYAPIGACPRQCGDGHAALLCKVP